MRYAEMMRDNGVNVVWIPGEEITKGYGAAHCMTQVISRRK